jgi:hypothetical protein
MSSKDKVEHPLCLEYQLRHFSDIKRIIKGFIGSIFFLSQINAFNLAYPSENKHYIARECCYLNVSCGGILIGSQIPAALMFIAKPH